MEGRRRRVCRGGQGCAAQPRPEEAVRGGAAEWRRTPGDRHGARRAHRGVVDASQRRARAVPVVAGAAAAGGSDWRGGDRPHPHRAEHQKPLGLLRALRSARRAPAVSERCRYAVDRPRPVPVVERFVIRARPSAAASGFAYQELGQFDKAIAAFDEAHRLSPEDPAITGYLIEANLAGKKYSMAADLARVARSQRPDDLRLARLEAQALRQTGKPDQGIAVLQDVVKKHADEPAAYVALAQLYSDASRGADAVQLLRDVEPKFPADTAIPFELGAVFDKQKRFADAEAAFHRVLARQPDNAAALNYLGYMLAERGERLDESVRYLKKALEIEPDNGSFLDSLGWAYYKSDKLDLALDNLRRAADQLKTNSVIQDHYGDVLFKLKRYDEAIAAWTRVLSGDGESIDRGGIDKKIRAAKQKLGKK
ncbi:MAG: hypothetical protein DMF92_10985 [Acidobacteria bacterium]|nr:MAG: hypothetical protein DMF92_10985 [Acidobacteriota bacterium]